MEVAKYLHIDVFQFRAAGEEQYVKRLVALDPLVVALVRGSD